MVKILVSPPWKILIRLALIFVLLSLMITFFILFIYGTYSKLIEDKSWDNLSTIRKVGRSMAYLSRTFKLNPPRSFERVSVNLYNILL